MTAILTLASIIMGGAVGAFVSRWSYLQGRRHEKQLWVDRLIRANATRFEEP